MRSFAFEYRSNWWNVVRQKLKTADLEVAYDLFLSAVIAIEEMDTKICEMKQQLAELKQKRVNFENLTPDLLEDFDREYPSDGLQKTMENEVAERNRFVRLYNMHYFDVPWPSRRLLRNPLPEGFKEIKLEKEEVD